MAIYNMLGQLISEDELNKTSANTHGKILDMSKQNSGIYLIKVYDNETNMLKTVRVIVK